MHILTTSATVRRIVNMTALAVVDAQQEAAEAAPPLGRHAVPQAGAPKGRPFRAHGLAGNAGAPSSRHAKNAH